MTIPGLAGRGRSRPAAWALGALGLALGSSALAGCGGGASSAKTPAGVAVVGAKDRPPLVLVTREGDPRAGLAAAVLTAGLDEHDGDAAAALAGLVEARLRASGYADAQVTVSRSSYRVRLLTRGEGHEAADVEALAAALARPATGDAAGLAAARRKLGALARREAARAGLPAAEACTDELLPGPRTESRAASLTDAELETFRQRAHGLGRIAFGFAGNEAAARRAEEGLHRSPGFREGAPMGPGPGVTSSTASVARLASAPSPDATTTATFALYTKAADDAARLAPLLGESRGALRARLSGLEASPRVRQIAATALPEGGCLAVKLEWSNRELGDGAGAATRVASALVLTAQEAMLGLDDPGVVGALGAAQARLGPDPRDAAERAAFWRLSRPRAAAAEATFGVAWAAPREGGDGWVEARSREASAALAKAERALQEPVVETRLRVERGQGELWMLLASPCGTRSETTDDAGLSGLFALAAAHRADALLLDQGAAAEAVVTQDAVGIVVHGAALPGEGPLAHGRRLADAAGRAFAAEALGQDATAHARAESLPRLASYESSPLLPALGSILAPGHPSWILPWGTTESVGRQSHGALAARTAALRAGPLRLAVLANGDAAQARATATAVDRWIARRPGSARSCPAVEGAPSVRPGTYAVEAPSSGAARDVWVAVPFAPDEESLEAGELVAAALDGPGGLLARALGDKGLARAASAQILGAPGAPVLALHVTPAGPHADAAVAQLRALLERLRQGALGEADRARALAMREQRTLAANLDPRGRLLALLRGEPLRGEGARRAPSLEALRAFAAATLREESLVVVTGAAS